MFCPKCGDVELQPVKADKLEYLACTGSCEGVWVEKKDLEKYWGKKRLKKLEGALEEAKTPDFGAESFDSEESSGDDDEEMDELDEDDEVEELDDDDEDDIDYDDYDDYDDDEDDEVEEVRFGDDRIHSLSYFTEDGEYDEPRAEEAPDNFTDSTDLIEEDDDENIQVEEESFFWTSPISGNPMKRFFFNARDKHKMNIGFCSDGESYWLDGSEEVLSLIHDLFKGQPRDWAELLAYERPEEEVFEDEDEDDEL